MKELYIKFDFNVKVEVDDDDEVKDKIIDWWVNATELPDYQISEKEEV